MANNNEVEVKISANQSELSSGLTQAENRVKDAADNISAIAEGIKNAFAGVRTSLERLDIKINMDMSDLQSNLNSIRDNVKLRFDQISNDVKIKLNLDTTALNNDLNQAVTLIRSRLATLPIQNIRVEFDQTAIQRALSRINSQNHRIRISINFTALQSDITQARNLIDSLFGARQNNSINLNVNIARLRSQLVQARTLVTRAIQQMQTSNINLNAVVNVDATSSALRTSLNSLKQSIDQLRTRLNNGGGGGGGGGGPGGGGGIGTSFASNFLAGMAQQLISSLGEISRALIENARQIENMSRLANASTTEFQEWAFATKSVGIDQEKLGDIMKDVNDKLGDYMQTGGGEMADFFEKIAPKVGVTAKEFQNLSGPQVLQKYYETLQKANVSHAEMTFYMESIANDGSLLAPILDNNGQKLGIMAEEAHKLGIILDAEALKATKEFGASLSTINAILAGTAQRMLAEMAPSLTALSNEFKEFAIDNRDAIDGSMQAIIQIFTDLLGIVGDIFGTIGGLWGDLTATTDSEIVQQIEFIDILKGALQTLSIVVATVRAGIQIAFALIRQVVIEVLAKVIERVINTEKYFGLFRTNVVFFIDAVVSSLRTFATVAENALKLNFTGIQAAWEQGFNNLEKLANERTKRIAKINEQAALKHEANQATRDEGRKNTVNTAVDIVLGVHNLVMNLGKSESPSTSATTSQPAPNLRSSIGTGVKPSSGSSVDSAKAKADAALEKAKREQEEQERKAAELKYKYASDEEKIDQDLAKAKKAISDSVKTSEDDKRAYTLKAEAEAAEKRKQLDIKHLADRQKLAAEEIPNDEAVAQRLFDLEMARLEAELDVGSVTHVEKVRREQNLQEALHQVKLNALVKQLALEKEMAGLTGDQSKVGSVNNQIANLDNQKMISDTKQSGLMTAAGLDDFDRKFGDVTDRISGMWDNAMQSMMNGTFTWKNATNTALLDMSGFFIQKMVTEPLRRYSAGPAQRLAVKMGFMVKETATEATGQAMQTGAVIAGETAKTSATSVGSIARLGIKAGEAIKTIMMYAWEAMAGAFKAMVSIPYIGPILAVGAGASALALVGGLASNIKSARGGYDIPAGVNPMTQLHEQEMVLPAQHANTIRQLGKLANSDGLGNSGGEMSGGVTNFNIQAWDSKDVRKFMNKHAKAVAGGIKGYGRGFGK